MLNLLNQKEPETNETHPIFSIFYYSSSRVPLWKLDLVFLFYQIKSPFSTVRDSRGKLIIIFIPSHPFLLSNVGAEHFEGKVSDFGIDWTCTKPIHPFSLLFSANCMHFDCLSVRIWRNWMICDHSFSLGLGTGKIFSFLKTHENNAWILL
jgi:hypothetical protein